MTSFVVYLFVAAGSHPDGMILPTLPVRIVMSSQSQCWAVDIAILHSTLAGLVVLNMDEISSRRLFLFLAEGLPVHRSSKASEAQPCVFD